MYAIQRGRARVSGTGKATTANEIWTFLGIVVLMGINVRHRLNSYWCKDSFLGIPALAQCMSSSSSVFATCISLTKPA